MLDPIKGKSISKLKEGEKIFIRILPDSERANYCIQLYKLREDKEIRPVPGSIQAIKRFNKIVEITLQLEDTLFCKVKEEANVMVKMAHPNETIHSVIAKKTNEKKAINKTTKNNVYVEKKIVSDNTYKKNTGLSSHFSVTTILLGFAILILTIFIYVLLD